jgi:hypothetical protein
MFRTEPWQRLPLYQQEAEGGAAGGEGEAGGDVDAAAASAAAESDGGAVWHSSITDPEELKNAERFTDLASLNRAHMDLRQRNAKMINVPGEDATDEDRTRFNKAIGANADPEVYTKDMDWSAYGEDYQPTEEQSAELQAFAEIAALNGVPVSAFNAMAKSYTEAQAQVQTDLQQQNADIQEKFTAELKELWGPDFERNMTLKDVGVTRVAKAMGVPVDDFKAVLNAPIQHSDVQIGNTPAVVKLMVMAAQMLGEDAAADMGDVSGRRESLEKERDAIEEKISRGEKMTKAEQARRLEIYEILDTLGGGQQAA